MNYIKPTFHFQQGDELCFSTSPSFSTSTSNSTIITQQQHLLPDMLLAPTPSPLLVEDPQILQSGHPNQTPNSVADKNQGTNNRKITHRDVERQRRHEMALLYASLRSHLPTEYLKDKRSISDHMNEAANYIKHQQEKIRRLTEKRDALRRVTSSSPSNSASPSASRILALPDVIVQSCYAGVKVVITSTEPDDKVPLSKLVAAFVGEGLDVVSLLSTIINEKSVCAIQCEVKAGGLGHVDLGGLKEKLIVAMRSLD